MHLLYVWDRFIRLFHWSLVALFVANAGVVDPDVNIHQWIGYAVVGLVMARMCWGFVGSSYARFASFPPDARASLNHLKEIATRHRVPHAGHSPLGALMIYNLIATVLAIGASGYLMTTDAFWGTVWPEELHEALVTWAEISVALHITAVVFESRRTKVNLALSMVTGYKELPIPKAQDPET